jgi:hypothetical protein
MAFADNASAAHTQQSGSPDGLAYRLLTGRDDADFCRRVSEWIGSGYTPYGNPTMAVRRGVVTVGQALVWPPRPASDRAKERLDAESP